MAKVSFCTGVYRFESQCQATSCARHVVFEVDAISLHSFPHNVHGQYMLNPTTATNRRNLQQSQMIRTIENSSYTIADDFYNIKWFLQSI